MRKHDASPAASGGRLFRRRSRHTGAELPTWWIAYCVDGKERRESAHSGDVEEARRLLRKRLHAADEGTYMPPERERLTVNAILDALLDYYVTHGKPSAATAPAQVKAWREPLGTVRALALTTGRVLRLTRLWQDAGTTNATINRRLALLHRAYRLAKLRLDPARLDFTDCFLDECSPLGKHLSRDVFHAIAAQFDPGRRAFCEFCYLTGKRKGQMSRTTWTHYDAAAAEFTWSADEVKGRRPEVLPLAGRALELIRALHANRRLHCRYVFHGPRCAPGVAPSTRYGCVGEFKRAWATACRKAGVPAGRKAGGYIFHNTRHTAVTNLVNAGVPAHEVMAVSGHRTRSVLDRYSLTLKAQTRAALERVTGLGSDTLSDTPREALAKTSGGCRAKGTES
jgi:integrase